MTQDVKYWPEWGPVKALNLDAPSHWKRQAGAESRPARASSEMPKGALRWRRHPGGHSRGGDR